MNSSLSSASEYRPKTFKDMIGQDAIVKTLSNAIKNDNIPQALLFCGPRGVGKTSCARILAKNINNLEENFEYNIFELDAASNNSVEDIRNITDQIRIPPQVGKYKVYIIDEVHMLSNQAFNAFLKSLEEPPKHVVFILATTEKNKIIPTILSRCQIYDFKKVDNTSIIKLLSNICEDKKIKYDENSLSLIADKSDGSIRDSLSMFDRLVSFTDSNLNTENVTLNLNILDYDTYFEISSYILEKNINGILTKYNDIYNRGFDDVNLLNGLSRHFREILINKMNSSDNISSLKNDLVKKYLKYSKDFSDENLILMIDVINETLINYQKVNDKRIHTELCLMKLASIDSSKKKKSLIKTSELKNFKNDSNQIKTKQLSSTSNLLIDNKEKNISSLSLASLNLKKTNEIIEKEILPNNEFTENDFLNAWKKFCEIEKDNGNNNILSLLNMNNPSIKDNVVFINTVNKMNFKEVNAYKNKIQAFISKELNNYSVSVEVKLSKDKNKKSYIDNKEKLDIISKSNTSVALLIDEFKLRI